MPDQTGDVGRVLNVRFLLDQFLRCVAEKNLQLSALETLLCVLLEHGPVLGLMVEGSKRSPFAFAFAITFQMANRQVVEFIAVHDGSRNEVLDVRFVMEELILSDFLTAEGASAARLFPETIP